MYYSQLTALAVRAVIEERVLRAERARLARRALREVRANRTYRLGCARRPPAFIPRQSPAGTRGLIGGAGDQPARHR
jgi:hypothetical protein